MTMTMPGTPLGSHPLHATFGREAATGADLDAGAIRANGLEIDVDRCNPETVCAAYVEWLKYLMQTTSACPEYQAALDKALESQTYLTRRQQMRIAAGIPAG